jgi:hypothetical protein
MFSDCWPIHLVNHLATMADLHRTGRYDRMSDDVLMLTGQGPLSVQDFVRKNEAIFTASAKWPVRLRMLALHNPNFPFKRTHMSKEYDWPSK